MSKKETTVFNYDQGTTFGEEGLENEVYMKKEKRYGIMKSPKIKIIIFY